MCYHIIGRAALFVSPFYSILIGSLYSRLPATKNFFLSLPIFIYAIRLLYLTLDRHIVFGYLTLDRHIVFGRLYSLILCG